MRKLIYCGCFIFLTSCAVKNKLPTPPLTSPPANWTATEAYNQTSASSLHTVLSDELLALIDEALENNHDLRVTANLVDIASANRTFDRSQQWPDLSADMGFQRNEGIDRNDERNFENTYTAGLSASWELDIWGKLRNQSNAATYDLVAEQFTYEAARQSLSANVVLAWLDILEARQLLSQVERNLANQQQRLRHLERRLDKGLIDALDVRLQRNNLANLKDRMLLLDTNYHSALRQLEVLLGRYPSAESVSITQLPTITRHTPYNAPADILKHRPDLMAKEQQLMAAQMRVNEVKKELWPQLRITASYDNNSDSYSQLFDFEDWLSNFSTALLQPIFQGGSLRANVRKQQARSRLLVAEYQQLVLEAWQEVENYLYNEHIYLRRINTLEDALYEAQAVETLTMRKYEQGLVNSFELLTAQNRSIAAEDDLIQMRISSISNRIRLHLALGIKLDDAG